MIRWRERLLGKNAHQVFQGMATLAMGSGAARVVGIASIPILTRLYSPEDFGVLSVFTALVTMLVPFLTWRYVVAIPLPQINGTAMNILALSIVVLLGMTFVVSGALWAFGETILRWMSMELLIPWWWLIPIGGVGTALYEILSTWAVRRRAYPIIAKTQVTQSVIGNAIKIALGFFSFQPIGLIMGQIAAQSGGVGGFLLRFRSDFLRAKEQVSCRRILLLAKHYKDFPLYRLPSQLLLVFSTQAPLLIAAVIYDAETTGQLGLAFTVLAVPLNLIGNSMAKAYYGEVASLKRSPAKVYELTVSVQKRLLFFSFAPALVLFLLGEKIFVWIFGREWMLAGEFASMLSVYMLVQFVSTPLIQVLNLHKKQLVFLLINIFRSSSLIVIAWIVVHYEINARTFVQILSAFLFVFYSLVSVYILRLSYRQAQIIT